MKCNNKKLWSQFPCALYRNDYKDIEEMAKTVALQISVVCRANDISGSKRTIEPCHKYNGEFSWEKETN